MSKELIFVYNADSGKWKLAGYTPLNSIARYFFLQPLCHYMESLQVHLFNTWAWASWQGNEQAAVAGDFTMLASEVAPVIKTLIENDIEAVHNHMAHEQPRAFFLHFWGVGSVEKAR